MRNGKVPRTTVVSGTRPASGPPIAGALDLLEGMPWLLGVVALGLTAYGLYQFVRARYRRITPA